MKVLVIGGSGYIGTRLALRMLAAGQHTPTRSSRRAGGASLRLDTRDEDALTRALRHHDAVVNCVAGDAGAIAEGARVLARAAARVRIPALVHLSSMAVYGEREGQVDEGSTPGPAHGWYGRAKQAAEQHLAALGAQGVAVTILRPGCVWGPGSALWVGRIARWLAQGRLGDLGDLGDGWTNGVAVDDVCEAIVRSLQCPPPADVPRVYNLAAPDSPRWNTWFTDLALATGATPLRRIAPWQLQADAWMLGPPLHLARRLFPRAGRDGHGPDPISPGLLRLWRRQLRLDSTAATRALGLAWTPYELALAQSVAAWHSSGFTTSCAKAAAAGSAPPGAGRAG